MRAYEKILKDIQADRGTIVSISPMLPLKNLELHKKLDLSYPILSDQGNKYAGQLDLVFQLDKGVKSAYLTQGLDIPKYNGDESWQLPVTALFLLDARHTILYEWLETDYTRRPEPEDLLKELKKS